MGRITYEQWNDAIAYKLFCPENRGRPVYLQVDDDLLAEVGTEFGLDPTASRNSFIRAVRTRAALDRMPLKKFFHLRVWENDTSLPPPFIGFLGLCVLAAFDMERDASKGISAANYYARFEDLLGARRPPKFDDVHELWERLNRWLDEDLNGKFGRSTARYVNHKHVGYPISQALVRQTDRNKLPLFYERCGLQPNEADLRVDFIQSELEQWSQLSTFPFDQRFKRIFEREDSGTIRQVAEMVLAEYQVWDGRSVEEIRDGVVSAEITLHFEPDYDTCHLSLIPPAFSRNHTCLPEGRYRHDRLHYQLDHDAFTDEWFEPLSSKPFLQMVFAGQPIELHHQQYKLWFKPKPVLLFRKDDGTLGHWIYAASRPELKTSYQLMCQPELLPCLKEHLQTCAEFEGEIVLTNPLLQGWVWLRDVTFVRQTPTDDERLQTVVPKPPHVSLSLIGGLKLGRGRYLQGGEPKLSVKGLQQSTMLFVDDIAYGEIEPTNGEVDLVELGLSAGTHRFQIGKDGTQRQFHIVKSGHQPITTTPLGHVLGQEKEGIQPIRFGLSMVPENVEPTTIYVSGAKTVGGNQVSLAITHPVWVTCGSYTRCFILGRSPHQIVEHRLPNSNSKQSIIFPVLFKPQWILYAQGNKCRVEAIGSPAPPTKPIAAHENHRKWAVWVRNAKPPKKRLGRIWQTYCKVAKGIR